MVSTRNPEALLAAAIDEMLQRLTAVRRLLVAYSGGRDSHTLLALLAKHRQGLPLHAIHIHHGLQAQADSWQQHCQDVCQALAVELTVCPVNARPQQGEGPEAAARAARYQALGGQLQKGDCLLTAHHQNDQAETMLLQLLRGCGPEGLAAMPFSKALGKGRQVRPWLAIERSQIEACARQWGLQWIDDPSNDNTDLGRNFLRQQIIPQLQRHWPSMNRTLARNAVFFAEASELLESQAESDWQVCREGAERLSIASLRELPEARQRGLLRYWCRQRHIAPPASRHLQRILTDLLDARSDGQPRVDWPGGEVLAWRGHLYARRRRPRHEACPCIPWSPASQPRLPLPTGGTLSLQTTEQGGLDASLLQGQAISISFRQGGERITLAGQPHHRRLKSLLHDADIPPWQRAEIPLLYIGDELAAIAGIGVAKAFAAKGAGLTLVVSTD